MIQGLRTIKLGCLHESIVNVDK